MKQLAIADATLRLCASDESALGFKEKIGIVKNLVHLGVDVIETAPSAFTKSDVLFLHTAAAMTDRQVFSCPAGFSEESVETAWRAICKAPHPRLLVSAPVSTVQMEYFCHKTPAAMLENWTRTVAKAKALGAECEAALEDATRAEKDFLYQAVRTVIAAGADVVTFCDSAGTMFAGEMYRFLEDLRSNVPELDGVMLSVECSDELHFAPACAIACIRSGAGQIKTAVGAGKTLKLAQFADILRAKERELDVSTHLNMTECDHLAEKIAAIFAGRPAALSRVSASPDVEGVRFSASDDISAVGEAVKKLGYELADDDLKNVYEEFCRIARKKELGPKDLDAIVATVALQAPPTYALKNFVITSGNAITSMAHVVLLRDGAEVEGFSMGDGPIDAAFLAIENIHGAHYELDDFQISAVTEGREAVGTGIVRLRAGGKLYAGKGVSTDVVGAGINAYINALNKICYEENAEA
ncbi:MAG: hypothetical protein MJ016_01625 [Victivallaceae bacterium]|nr:hypothetical protein [Victivallaceae bacterium]